MERDYPHYDPDDDFELIESDSPIPYYKTKYIDISAVHDLEKIIIRLERIHRINGNCNNVRIKNGEDYHPLQTIIALDDQIFTKNLRQYLAEKALEEGDPKSSKPSFDKTANGVKKGDHMMLIIFDPDHRTLTTQGLNAKSILSKDGSQRLILPVNKRGIGISPHRLPLKPFVALATPSIRVKDGKTGILNWHAHSAAHIDLSNSPYQSVSIIKNIATVTKRVPHPHYTI